VRGGGPSLRVGDHLLEFLRFYRDAVQMVVNGFWDLDEKLS